MTISCWGVSPASTIGAIDPQTRFVDFNAIDESSDRKLGSTFETVQDHRGLIWIGTGSGLARYDGNELEFYENDPESGIDFGSNIIRKIVPNPDGTLWIGAFNGGISRFDPHRGKTTARYRFNEKTAEPNLLSNQIWSLKRTDSGDLWIGYFDGGVTHMNTETGETKHFRPDPAVPTAVGHGSLNLITRDSRGTLWIASYEEGLQKFSDSKNSFSSLSLKDNALSQQIDPRTWAVAEDSDGALWVGTSTGVYRLKGGDLSRPFENAGRKVRKALDSGVRSFLFDSAGRLWVGTAGAGVVLHWPGLKTSMAVPGTPYYTADFRPSIIWDIRENPDGSIWLSHNRGVSFVDPRLLAFDYISYDYLSKGIANRQTLRRFFSTTPHGTDLYAGAENVIFQFATSAGRLAPSPKRYILNPRDRAGLVETIFVDNEETIWAGTTRDGLYKKSRNDTDFARIKPDLIDFNNHTEIGFKTIDQINSKKLILGTVSAGIAIYDIEKNQLFNPKLSLPAKQVSLVHLLDPDTVFVGTFSGASVYNIKENTARQLDFPGNGESPFIHDVLRIDAASWYVGTSKGLYILKYTDSRYTLSEKIDPPEMPSNTSILSLEHGDNRSLWIGTSRGIVRFNGALNDDSYAGLYKAHPAGDIARGTLRKIPGGGMVLAGDEGIETFPSDLSLITEKHHHPVFSRVRFLSDSKEYSRNIIGSEAIKLKHSAQLIRIGFFPLDFIDYNGIERDYSYRLKGLNESWLKISGKPEAVFTHIPPGNYEFQVRFTMHREPTSGSFISLPLQITPPWWQTWWAYSIYGLVGFTLLLGYTLYYRRRLENERMISARLREADQLKDRFVEQLQEQVDSATDELRRNLEAMEVKNVELDLANRRSMEATQMKSEFLANISHEIRTPVGGIQGFLELLDYTDLTPEQEEYVRTIQSSAESLTAIVNDVLDVSKIEAGKLIVETIDFDILETLEKACQLLTPLAFKKQLELITIFDPQVPRSVRGDPTRFRQILTNLLGNAIKFTDEGSITVRLELDALNEEEVRVCLAVTDTGIGISSEDRERLFQPYHQISHGERKSGTGLGLTICKKLVDLMGGEIRIHSTPGVGSTFEIFLPLGRSEETVWSEPEQQLPDGKVAVVDEHPHAAEAMVGTLSAWGVEVIEFLGADSDFAPGELCTDGESQPVVIVRIPAGHTHNPGYLHPILQKLAKIDRVMVLISTMDQYILEKWRRETGVLCLSKSIRRDLFFRHLEPLIRQSGTDRGHRKQEDDGNDPGAGLTGRRILVADDNRINRRLIVSMVENHGAEIGEAETGPDVVVLAEAEDWDVILLDVHMPGLDGIESAENIRALPGKSSEALIIGISANALPETRKEALARGMDEYLIKPVREDNLLQIIQSYPGIADSRK